MNLLNTGRPLVIAVAPLPPPLHGAAATTKEILKFLEDKTKLKIANISPGKIGGVARHPIRLGKTFSAILMLVVNAFHRSRVLYMTADGGAGMIYNIMVAVTGTLLGYRIFLHHHSFAYVDRSTALMRCLSHVIARTGTHVVLCPKMASDLRARYPIGRTLELSSAALLPSRAKLEPSGSEGNLKLGFLSNLIIEKGLDTSIDLLDAAIAENLDVKLVIAGAATDPRALELITRAQARLGSSLSYLGPLTDEEKSQFLTDIDVFLFPSRYFNEAQPRAVLEALTFGRPVLTIARSCITSDMGDGTGLCAVDSDSFVAEAMKLLREWNRDRQKLRDTSARASARSAVLHSTGLKHLDSLATAFSSTVA